MFTCPYSAGPIQLWQFLLELLRDGERSNCIRWTGNSREFQLCDPREVGQLPRPAKSRPNLLQFNLAEAVSLALGPAPISYSSLPQRELKGLSLAQNFPETACPAPARRLPSPAPC